MTRAELGDDPCPVCEARLSTADYVERHEIVFATGEFSGQPGTAIVAECSCGITSVIPLSVNLRKVA